MLYNYDKEYRNIEEIDAVTFSYLKMKEGDIEEILRRNINMLCDDEESMLIVGQQVNNEKKGRSDLTAVDNDGKIVVIEIKRDPGDYENRSEAFEIQALRYAASCATIKNPDELVGKVYSLYIEKHHEDFELLGGTYETGRRSYETGWKSLNDFLDKHEIKDKFNSKQRIILVASGFDEQTLSSVAWLINNNIEISCFKIVPHEINGEVFFYIEKLLPVTKCEEYYVNLMDKSNPSFGKNNKNITRRQLPKIDTMLSWGVVKKGDIIVAKGMKEEATLLENGKVMVKEKEESIQSWLKKIYGWSSVATYEFTIHKNSGKTLSQIRDEYMEEMISEKKEGS